MFLFTATKVRTKQTTKKNTDQPDYSFTNIIVLVFLGAIVWFGINYGNKGQVQDSSVETPTVLNGISDVDNIVEIQGYNGNLIVERSETRFTVTDASQSLDLLYLMVMSRYPDCGNDRIVEEMCKLYRFINELMMSDNRKFRQKGREFNSRLMQILFAFQKRCDPDFTFEEACKK